MENLLQQFSAAGLDNAIANSKSKGIVDEDVPQCITQMISHFEPQLFCLLYSINLSNQKLKQIPSCLKVCQCLQELNLSNNELTRLPSLFIVTYFPFLKILDVSDNYLTEIADLVDFGILKDLELFQCLGNPLSKIASLAEFAETLLFHPSTSEDLKQSEIQRKKIELGVFLEMGSFWTVKNQFIYQLSMILKAFDNATENKSYLTLNRLDYEKNELSVDQQKLIDGSLFVAVENDALEVGIEMPGCLLYKDIRLEAPIVIIGCDFKRCFRINSLTGKQQEQLYAFINQDNGVLKNTSEQDMVSKFVMKYSFFGQNYFCYNLPFKKNMGKDQNTQNDRKISTIELINKKVTKDIRIMTSTKQARLDYLKIDVNEMLPSEIQQKLKQYLHENHYFTNMNQRNLNNEKSWFPRLRLLNGQMLTVDDYDKAQNEFRLQRETLQLMQAAAFYQCQTKIPHNLTQYAKKQKVGNVEGMAAQDLKKQVTHVVQIKPLSEEIKARQAYERLSKLSKQERKDALRDLRDFITNGKLKESDVEEQFSEILRRYDNDEDADLDDFLADCRKMADHYKAELFADEQAESYENQVVGNVFDRLDGDPRLLASSQKTASMFAFSQKLQQSTENSQFLDGSIKVEDLQTSQLSQIAQIDVSQQNQSQTVQFAGLNQRVVQDLDDAYDELMISRTLQQSSPSKGVNKRDYAEFEAKMLGETKGNQSVFGPKRTKITQQHLEASLLQAQVARERSNIRKLATGATQRAGIVQPKGLRNTLNITEDEAVGVLSIAQSMDPIQHVIRNTQLFVNVESKVDKFDPKSKILTKPNEEDKNPLDKPLNLEQGNLNFQDVKDVKVDKALYQQMNSVNENQLKPDFNLFLQQELQLQHASNDRLMMEMSKNVDRTVRESILKRSSLFRYTDKATKKTELCHSTLLDIIRQGDRLSGNPNGVKLSSAFTGKINPAKMNEAQEILRNESRQVKTRPKLMLETNQQTLFNPLQPTSREIMDAIDNKLAREDLAFEQDRIKMVFSNKCGDGQQAQNQQIMRSLIKQNNADIANTERQEMQVKHKQNLAIIQSSTMDVANDIKQAPTLFQYAKEVKQLEKIQQRNEVARMARTRDTTISDTYYNPQLRYKNINDKSAIEPIPVRSAKNAKMFGTNVVQTLNVPSVEEAAQHAAQLVKDIPVNELIEKSNYIMQNSAKELADLQQYQRDFARIEAQYDENQNDPLYLLLKDQDYEDDNVFDRFKKAELKEKKAAQLLNVQTNKAHQLIESVQNQLWGKLK